LTSLSEIYPALNLAKKIKNLTALKNIRLQPLDVCPQIWYILGEHAETFSANLRPVWGRQVYRADLPAKAWRST